MAETKVQTTWLQCTLPKADWDKLNERRLKLGLKWADIVIPGTEAYLAKLETDAKLRNTSAEMGVTLHKIGEAPELQKTNRT
jgi:hypothetical protein